MLLYHPWLSWLLYLIWSHDPILECFDSPSRVYPCGKVKKCFPSLNDHYNVDSLKNFVLRYLFFQCLIWLN